MHEPYPPDVAATLRRIAEYEATVRRSWLTRFLGAAAHAPLISRLYRSVGPRLDTLLGRKLDGRVLAEVYGLPGLILVTRGAKTGLPRTAPLLYVRDGDDFVVVGTNFGQAHHPAWSNNLLAHPDATIEVGPARLDVRGSLVDEGQFRALWPRFVALGSVYETYLERSGRTPRMFRLSPRVGEGAGSGA